jgi:hypothetical protein
MQHAQSAGLIFSMKIGLVSPQFHVKYDNTFTTVTQNSEGASIPESSWQQKCGFNQADATKYSMQDIPRDNVIESNLMSEHTLQTTMDADSGDQPQHEYEEVAPPSVEIVPCEIPTITTRSGRTVRPPAGYHFLLRMSV